MPGEQVPEGLFRHACLRDKLDKAPGKAPHKFQVSEPLAKLRIQGELNTRKEAKAGGAGGHFWHDAVINANTITPAK